MLLRHLHWYSDQSEGEGDLRITRGLIKEIGKGLAPGFRERVIDLRDCLALPGLVNAHDHLDFNLLPIPGHPPYSNFIDYAQEIYRPDEPPVCAMLRVPLRARLQWGGYKNLLSGVTSVCHHNAHHRSLGKNFPIRVVKTPWSHSLSYSTGPVGDFRRARGKPFIIHAAEGTDSKARSEIKELDRLGMLESNTIIVHGVAVREQEIGALERAGSALIWCPTSNMNLFGHTAPIEQLSGRVPLALATDSILTGSTTLFDEIRAAHATGLAGPDEILRMVTSCPAAILRLPAGAGSLRAGTAADLIVLPDLRDRPSDTLLCSHPQDLNLVMIGGEMHLAEPAISGLPPNVEIAGKPRYIKGNVAKLKGRIAGRMRTSTSAVAETPLWQMLQPLGQH